MDPSCPLYGKKPLPLPKSMETLFPVRFIDKIPLVVERFEVDYYLICRIGSTRERETKDSMTIS